MQLACRRMATPRHIITGAVQTCLVLFLMATDLVSRPADCQQLYHEVSNTGGVGLQSLLTKETEPDSLVCAIRCASEIECQGFTWNQAHSTCTIGRGLGITEDEEDQADGDNTRLYVDVKLCRYDLGYEIRSTGATGTTSPRCLFLSSSHVTYEEAQADCYSHGGILFMPNTGELIQMLQRFAEEKGNTDHSVFIGLDDLGEEGRFRWSNGDKMTDKEKENLFFIHEPNNYANEDCVAVIMEYGKLWDISCWDNMSYACEMSMVQSSDDYYEMKAI